MHDVEVVEGQGRALTAAEFHKLADVPPEIERFANLRNPNTRLAHEHDLREFRQFVGIERPEEFQTITRAHVIAWRRDLERHLCAPATIQRKLTALSSLFAYLCEQNAVLHNPVDGVKRPKSNRREATPPEAMRGWLADATVLSPLRWFNEIAFGVFLRRVTLHDLALPIGALSSLGVLFFGWGALRFRVRFHHEPSYERP